MLHQISEEDIRVKEVVRELDGKDAIPVCCRCLHYQAKQTDVETASGGTWESQSCSKSATFTVAYMVHGSKNYFLLCKKMRLDEDKCGRRGKFFEEKL
jgi:hypothetical protein